MEACLADPNILLLMQGLQLKFCMVLSHTINNLKYIVKEKALNHIYIIYELLQLQ